MLFLALLARPVFSEEARAIPAAELIRRGRAELASNRWDAAESFFRLAVDSEPTNSVAYTGLGYSLANLDRHREATAALGKALELDPCKTNAWLYLGGSQYMLGNYERAVDAYQQYVSLQPENDTAYYWLSRSLGQLKRYGAAEIACRRAIAIDPTRSYYYASLGYYLGGLRRYHEAVKSFEKALSLNPDDADTHLRLGISHYREKTYQGAVVSLQEYISLQPSNSEGYYWLGRSFSALGFYDKAANAFQDAVRVNPNDFEANDWRGMTLVRLGRYAEAASSFEKAYEVKKEDKTLRLELFYCYLVSSQYENAFRLYPALFAFGGGTLVLAYVIGFAVLWRFSFKVSSAPCPGLGFSFGWLALFFEGQVAFIFCLGLLSLVRISQSFLFGITLAGIPVIFAAARGFTRQPWGRPFAPPLPLGTVKVVGLSLLGLVLTRFLGTWWVEWMAWVMHRPMAAQDTIPFIKHALSGNPLAASLSIVVIGPMAEEIIFRGLMYGALEKRLRVSGAILASSLVFALVHLQAMYVVPIFLLGMVLGWARWKTGSLGLPILLHVLNNGVALLLLRSFEKF
jgi:tetratricopeptide (TPR) repeat protein